MTGNCSGTVALKPHKFEIKKLMKTGQLIKELRLKKGITQEDLAAMTDISVRTIQRIESGEVDPRAYTLQSIAGALGVEYETLAMADPSSGESAKKDTSKWLPLIHLSGLLILIVPPIVLYILKRDEVKDIKKHATDVINYQLSISLYALPFVLSSAYPVVMVLFIYSQIVIILNSMKVAAHQPYKYHLNIKFIKAYQQELSLS
jgi:transcriptional regulator with XRE-family HTH domain